MHHKSLLALELIIIASACVLLMIQTHGKIIALTGCGKIMLPPLLFTSVSA
jgi:F0F1-type ATP synthase assembly protein I